MSTEKETVEESYEDRTPPEGFDLSKAVVPAATWNILEKWMETGLDGNQSVPLPWQTATENRKVAQFGFHYDYETSQVVIRDGDGVPPIPDILRQTLLDTESTRLPRIDPGTCLQNFTQCIINCYEKDVFIPWHTDHSDFGPIILVYTFGESRALHFRKAVEGSDCPAYEYFTAYPSHGSRYILSGPAREVWEHSVPKGDGRRVSITFRTHRNGIAADGK